MFAMVLSGRMTVELNPPGRQLADIERALKRLDGETRFSVVVFPLPPGARLDDLDTKSYESGYLQCAGSSEQMTVELREHDGVAFRQYAIARIAELSHDEPDEMIRWASFETRVNPAELFTRTLASELFAAYLNTVSIPDRFHRRLLEL